MKKHSCRAAERGQTREHFSPVQGQEPALEYLLPVGIDDLREKDASILTPWFRRFLNRDGREIKMLLVSDWISLSGPSAVISSFLTYSTPRSLYFPSVTSGSPVLLGLDDDRLENRYSLLSEPAALNAEGLGILKNFRVEGIVEWVTNFHELHMGLSIFCLRLGSRIELLTEDDYNDLGEWSGAMVVLNSMADHLHILRKDGIVGVWDTTVGGPAIDGAIEKERDFDGFLNWYCAFRRTHIF